MPEKAPSVPVDASKPQTKPTTRVCIDCGLEKPLEAFRMLSKAKHLRAKDCEACRNAKIEDGKARARLDAKGENITREWLMKEAKRLYMSRSKVTSDKLKLLEIMNKNLNPNDRSLADDAKVIRDLMASRRSQLEPDPETPVQ